jgi:hypothetical protein
MKATAEAITIPRRPKMSEAFAQTGVEVVLARVNALRIKA